MVSGGKFDEISAFRRLYILLFYYLGRSNEKRRNGKSVFKKIEFVVKFCYKRISIDSAVIPLRRKTYIFSKYILRLLLLFPRHNEIVKNYL